MRIVFHVMLFWCLLIFPTIGTAQQPAGTLNVKTAGAGVGDGLTDDAVAIQAILDTADAQNKNLYFPPGTYVIGSDITTRKGVSLLGDHAGVSIIRSTPGTIHTIGNQTWSDPGSNVDGEELNSGSENLRK